MSAGRPQEDGRRGTRLTVWTYVDNGVTVVLARGEIDAGSGEQLREALRSAVAADSSEPVLIDLCHVEFMDSTGLHHFLNAHRRLKRQDRKLTVLCPPGPVLHVLETVGMIETLGVHQTRPAALRALA